MCHQFIALLSGGIEADGIVDLIFRGIGNLLVTAIDGGTAGIDQVLYRMMAASLQDIIESNQIALDIAIRIGDAVTHSSLRSKVDYHFYLVFCENLLD